MKILTRPRGWAGDARSRLPPALSHCEARPERGRVLDEETMAALGEDPAEFKALAG